MVMSILTVGDDSFVVDLDEPFVSFLERLSIVSQKDKSDVIFERRKKTEVFYEIAINKWRE